MGLVKKTIEIDQDAINRIKAALNVKTEKEAINTVIKQFDIDIRLAEITFRSAGTFDFEKVFSDRSDRNYKKYSRFQIDTK